MMRSLNHPTCDADASLKKPAPHSKYYSSDEKRTTRTTPKPMLRNPLPSAWSFHSLELGTPAWYYKAQSGDADRVEGRRYRGPFNVH